MDKEPLCWFQWFWQSPSLLASAMLLLTILCLVSPESLPKSSRTRNRTSLVLLTVLLLAKYVTLWKSLQFFCPIPSTVRWVGWDQLFFTFMRIIDPPVMTLSPHLNELSHKIVSIVSHSYGLSEIWISLNICGLASLSIILWWSQLIKLFTFWDFWRDKTWWWLWAGKMSKNNENVNLMKSNVPSFL